MEEDYFNKFILTSVLIILFVLAGLVLKNLLISLILGVLLAFLFYPIYCKVNKRLNSPTISATILCIFLLTLIVIPVWLLSPMVFSQTFDLYLSAQRVDIGEPIKKVLGSFIDSREVVAEIASKSNSLVSKILSYFVNLVYEFILALPVFFLYFLIVLFAFFYFLRDRETFKKYIVGIFPFPKDVEEKFFFQTGEITTSIIYGQFLIGTIQGLVTGVGFYLFGVKSALVWTIVAMVMGILPIIGPPTVWIPMAIYIWISGSPLGGIGISFFGMLSSAIDTVGKPFFISKNSRIHPIVVFVGMVGGVLHFGFLGFLLGPLILAYLLIVLDLYREKNKSILK